MRRVRNFVPWLYKPKAIVFADNEIAPPVSTTCLQPIHILSTENFSGGAVLGVWFESSHRIGDRITSLGSVIFSEAVMSDDDIDFDRVVSDPTYRREVMDFLKSAEATADETERENSASAGSDAHSRP